MKNYQINQSQVFPHDDVTGKIKPKHAFRPISTYLPYQK